MSMQAPFGAMGRYLTRAVALTGMSKLLMQWFYDPMIMGLNVTTGTSKPPWQVNNTAVVGTHPGVVVQGGVQRVAVTGGGGGGFSAFEIDTNGSCQFKALQTSKWYYAARARSLTGVSATSGAYGGFKDVTGANVVRVGLNGRASTTNFSIAHGAFNAVTASQTGPAVDTNFHDFEMWCVGDSILHWAMDGVEQTTLAAPAFTDMFIIVIVENGNADIDVSWDTDDVCAVWESAA
jgi:hypothetical protein